MIFPVTKSKYKILKEVYENPGITISELMRKANVSQKVLYQHIEELKDVGVVREEIIGTKPQIRRIYPALKTENGKLLFSLVESQKKEEFFSKYRNLKGPFLHLLQNLPDNVVCILVFGSYAKFSATRESDLDLLFISFDKKSSKVERIVEEAFVTFEKVSARIITVEEFLKNKNTDSILKQVIKDHVCIFNTQKFVELLSKD
jgi:predicted nucleotidyltransferase/DNA-binding HxlR family transcriptional regulator